ncbi:MAG TPA: FG-GAP-like repeat-containing protein [Rhodothermales bacterium]|nr:FG-GAP-like repeat-containing protein [Rhodothermales bacterium]
MPSPPVRRARRAALLAALVAAVGPVAHAQTPAYTVGATPTGLVPAGVGYMNAPAAADFDRDGDVDVVRGRADGSLSFFRNTAGVYTEVIGLITTISGTFAAAPAAADFDRDGIVDLVVGYGDGTFRFYAATLPSGLLTFTLDTTPTGLADVGNNAVPFVVDLDGDGDLDVVAGRTDGTLAYFGNTAGVGVTPTFTEGTGASNPFNGKDVGFSSAPTVADLDGDGDLDLAVGSATGEISVALNSAGRGAAPVFGTLTAAVFGLSDPGYASVPTAVDLDLDGDLDVLVGTPQGAYAYNVNGAAGPLTAVLTGAEGWRMLAGPTATVTLASLLGPLWTQGVPGSDFPGGAPPAVPNVLRYDETVTTDTDGSGGNTAADGYVAPGNMSEAAGLGRGLYVYVYLDDDYGTPGTQGGFPKTLTATGTVRTTPFRWAPTGGDGVVTYTSTGNVVNDGWNLLGNPFGSWLDWDATAATSLDASVYVYDPATVNYRVYSRGVGGSLAGGIIGAFQGFYTHGTAAGPSLTAVPAPADGGPVYGRTETGDDLTRVALTLRPAEGTPGLSPEARSEVLLALGADGAAAGQDALDAYTLAPPAASYVLLSTEAAGADGAPVGLSVDARGARTAEVALGVSAVADGQPVGGALTLAWPAAEGLAPGATARLRDLATGAELDLTTAGEYTFTLEGAPATAARGTGPMEESAAAVPGLGAPTVVRPGAAPGVAATVGRFVVVVNGAVTGTEGAPTAFALSAPRPNPATGRATLTLDLPQVAAVTVALYDALGRRVALLADGQQAAGRLTLTVDASSLPAGVYVVRADVGGGQSRTFTQRLSVTR